MSKFMLPTVQSLISRPCLSFQSQRLFKELVDRVSDHSGEKRGLCLLVGAGTSIPSSFPSWDKLLQNIRDTCFDDNALFEYEQLCRIDPGMSRDRQAWLTVALAKAARNSNNPTDVIHAGLYKDIGVIKPSALAKEVMRLHFCHSNSVIATTNYDDVLGVAYEHLTPNNSRLDRYSLGRDEDTEQTAEQWQRALENNTFRRTILHLHGYLPQDSEDKRLHPVILTEAFYAAYSRQAVEVLRKAMNGRTVLLVGMSATDTTVLSALKAVNDLDEDTQVYTLQVLRTGGSAKDEEAQVSAHVKLASELFEEYGLRTIFLKNYSQVRQCIQEISLAVLDSESYFADGSTGTRYGHRLNKMFDLFNKPTSGISLYSDESYLDNSTKLSAAFEKKILPKLRELQNDKHMRSASDEKFGAEIWLRQFNQSLPDGYGLCQIASTTPIVISGVPIRDSAHIKLDSNNAAAAALSEGDDLFRAIDDSRSHNNWWRSVHACPIYIHPADGTALGEKLRTRSQDIGQEGGMDEVMPLGSVIAGAVTLYGTLPPSKEPSETGISILDRFSEQDRDDVRGMMKSLAASFLEEFFAS